MSSKLPNRLGIALKNQICTTGAASSVWPIRFATDAAMRHLDATQRSQIMPLYFMPRYLPQAHSQSFSGPKDAARRTGRLFPDDRCGS